MPRKKKLSKKSKFELGLRLARKYIVRYEKFRFKIAEIAIEHCDPARGGRSADHIFTYSKFARALDIHPKTMMGWIQMKENVVDKLSVANKNKALKGLLFREISTVARNVKAGSSKAEVRRRFNEEMKVDPGYNKFRKYLQHMRSVIYNGSKPALLMEIPDDMIVQCHQYAKLITNLMEKEIKFREKFGKRGMSGLEDKALAKVAEIMDYQGHVFKKGNKPWNKK